MNQAQDDQQLPLQESLERLLDGHLRGPDLERFQNTLADNPFLLEQYMQHMLDSVLLHDLLAAPDDTSSQAARLGTPHAGDATRGKTHLDTPTPPDGLLPPVDPPTASDRPGASRRVPVVGWLGDWTLERWLDVTPIVLFGVLMLVLGTLVGMRLGTSERRASSVAEHVPTEQQPALSPPNRTPAVDPSQAAEGTEQPDAVEPSTPSAPSVAVLLAVDEAQWVDSSVDLKPGGRLAQNVPLRLASGWAEIVFDNGARVIVEGPASLVPENDSRCRLEAGKVVADVPPAAVGFQIKTPHAVVRDLGTRFGVQVDPAHVVQVMVFRGQVELIPPQQPAQRIRLAAGQGRELRSDDPANWGTALVEAARSALGTLAGRLADKDPPEQPVRGKHTDAEHARQTGTNANSERRPALFDRFVGGSLDATKWLVLKPTYRNNQAGDIVSDVAVLPGGGVRLINAPVLAAQADFDLHTAPYLEVRTKWRAETDNDHLRIIVRGKPEGALDGKSQPNMQAGILCLAGGGLAEDASVLAILPARNGQAEPTLLRTTDCPPIRAGHRYEMIVESDTHNVRLHVRQLGPNGWQQSVALSLPEGFLRPGMGKVIISNRGSGEQQRAATGPWKIVLENVTVSTSGPG